MKLRHVIETLPTIDKALRHFRGSEAAPCGASASAFQWEVQSLICYQLFESGNKFVFTDYPRLLGTQQLLPHELIGICV